MFCHKDMPLEERRAHLKEAERAMRKGERDSRKGLNVSLSRLRGDYEYWLVAVYKGADRNEAGTRSN